MAVAAGCSDSLVDDYLAPLAIDVDKCQVLSQRFLATFARLAAESHQQFLPTPISDSILRPIADHGHGRHLAIDIGGTNLRVGFIELLPKHSQPNGPRTNSRGCVDGASSSGRIRRHLEQQWSISNHLKTDNADSLFQWIGSCIAQVVAQGCRKFGLESDAPLPLGVTFSFPTEQHCLSEATIKSMGKGFAIPPDVELGARLQQGYSKSKTDDLPPIQVVAIANDSVATLVSFTFNYDGSARRRAAMGLILGTGSNATVPLRLEQLHPDKRQQQVSILSGDDRPLQVKVTVNTEWSINGTEAPMRQLGLITHWDDELSSHNERPGFQPLEYMTAGRYLGELGRIILVDYMTKVLGLCTEKLPAGLLQRHGLSTTFLSHFRPMEAALLVSKLRTEFPESSGRVTGFVWTEDVAAVLYRIAKAIEVRAAGITAAGVTALLTLAGDIGAEHGQNGEAAGCSNVEELGVGYTGGCIVHFQDYLVDCQRYIDELVARRCGGGAVRVALHACHDGGIVGAGILAAAALSSKKSMDA